MEFWHVVLLLAVFEVAFTIFNREYWLISPKVWYMYLVRVFYGFIVGMAWLNAIVWSIVIGAVWAVAGSYLSEWLDNWLDSLSNTIITFFSVVLSVALGILAVSLSQWCLYFIFDMDITFTDAVYSAFHKGEDQIVSIIYCLLVYIVPLILPVLLYFSQETPLAVLGGMLLSFVMSIIAAFIIIVVYGLLYEVMHMSFGSIFGIVAIIAALLIPSTIIIKIFVD